jgi:hypothetical protein
VALVVLMFLIAVGLWLSPRLGRGFWVAVVFSLLVLALVWWYAAGARMVARRRIRRLLADLRSCGTAEERTLTSRLLEAADSALLKIKQSPEWREGGQPLYRIPWIVFLGSGESNLDAVLKAGSAGSPFPPPDVLSATDLGWRWWLLKGLVGLQFSARFVCEESALLERGVWSRALEIIDERRPKLPLNGVVVALSARQLIRNDEDLHRQCQHFGRLLAEIMIRLQVEIPAYLLVTGLEELPGYGAFVAALPREVRSQAIGAWLEQPVEKSRTGSLRGAFNEILARLQAVRLGLLRVPQASAQDVFEFVEAVRRLEPGLGPVSDLLMDAEGTRHVPNWRALLLVGAGSSPAFIDDVVNSILPHEQPRASQSGSKRFFQWSRLAAAVLAALTVSGALSVALVQGARTDVDSASRIAVACPPIGNRAGAERIAWISTCGHAIELLEESSGVPFWFVGRSSGELEQLKNTVVREFSELVLAPYDQTLASDTSVRGADLQHLLALTQRLFLLDTCRSDVARCRRELESANLVFDPQSRLFSPFLSEDEARNARLGIQTADAYVGFIRWQNPDLIAQERARVLADLKRVASLARIEASDIEAWASARFHGVSRAALWKPGELRDEGEGPEDLAGAFTGRVWLGVLRPWLTRMEALGAPQVASAADAFRDYQELYFERWAKFLSEFPDGYPTGNGDRARLIESCATEGGPYLKLWKVLDANIYALPLSIPFAVRWKIAWARSKRDWLRGPVYFVKAVIGAVTATSDTMVGKIPPWVPALLFQRDGVLTSQAEEYALAYRRLQGDQTGSESYKLASAFFKGKGKASEPPASGYSVLWQSVATIDDGIATNLSPSDERVLAVARGPFRLMLSLTLYHASRFIQEKWKTVIAEPLERVPQAQRTEWLFGPSGKVKGFMADWLQPFLSEQGKQPIEIAGVAMPFSANYDNILALDSKSSGAPGGDEKPFLAGVFQFTQPSSFGRAKEGANGTSLEIQCSTGNVVVSTLAPSIVERKVNVFWSPKSCIRVLLRIAVPDTSVPTIATPGANSRPDVRTGVLSLVKAYGGPEGFVALLREFQTGARIFPLTDFRGAFTDGQWLQVMTRADELGIQDVRVFLAIESSDEMRRYLSEKAGPKALPLKLFE